MIVVNLDVMLAKRKTKLQDLAEAIGVTIQNLSVLKTGKAKAIRFSTLKAICKYLKCQPGIFWNTKILLRAAVLIAINA